MGSRQRETVQFQGFCNRKNKKPSEDREQKIAKIKEIPGQGKGKRAKIKKRPVSDTAKPENDGSLKEKNGQEKRPSHAQVRIWMEELNTWSWVCSTEEEQWWWQPFVQRTTLLNLRRLSGNSGECFLSQRRGRAQWVL